MGGLKDRKLYVAGLALALGGLVLDKTVFSGGLSPGTAQASDLVVDPAAPASASPAPAQTASENSAEIAQRLAGARDRFGLDPANVPDAFFGAGLNGKAAQKEADLSPEQRFRQSYTLHAVMRSEGGTSLALVEMKDKDGNLVKVPVRVGDTLDGAWKLAAVDTQSRDGRSATFESDGYSVVLTLPGPKADGLDQKAQGAGAGGR